MASLYTITMPPTVLLALAVGLTYLRSLGNVFVSYDDELLILNNPLVQGFNWANIKAVFTSYDPELYIPLTQITHQIESSLFGLHSIAVHTTSLVLHILSAVLVLQIFKKLLPSKVALLCALMFALHPINVEAVSWASGRKDVLSAFFFLLSIHWYLNDKTHKRSIIAFLCGLLSKVSVVPLPFALLLIDHIRGKPIDKNNLKAKLPYFILSFIFIIIALIGKSQVSDTATWMMLSLIAIPFHLVKYILPFHLSIFYPFTGDLSFSNPTILLGTLGTLGALGALIWSFRRHKGVFAALLWYLLLIAPALPTAIKGGEDNAIYLTMGSDRYVYLAGLGLIYLFGSWIAQKESRQKLTFGLIILCTVLTVRQSLVWRDSVSLFTNVIDQNRPSAVAHLVLAGVHAERGEYDKSIEQYEASIAIAPSSKALINLGQVQAIQGKHTEAIETYMQVIESWPHIADIHLYIGELYIKERNLKAALPYFEKSIELYPSLTAGHFNLGVLYEHFNRTADAKKAFERVLELEPGNVQVQRRLRLL